MTKSTHNSSRCASLVFQTKQQIRVKRLLEAEDKKSRKQKPTVNRMEGKGRKKSENKFRKTHSKLLMVVAPWGIETLGKRSADE